MKCTNRRTPGYEKTQKLDAYFYSTIIPMNDILNTETEATTIRVRLY